MSEYCDEQLDFVASGSHVTSDTSRSRTTGAVGTTPRNHLRRPMAFLNEWSLNMQYPRQVFTTACNCIEYVAMFMISRTAAITCVFHHTATITMEVPWSVLEELVCCTGKTLLRTARLSRADGTWCYLQHLRNHCTKQRRGHRQRPCCRTPQNVSDASSPADGSDEYMPAT